MTEHAITVRRMQFELPADLDPVFIAGEPEDSYANIALSLLLPYLEPYLIRSMKAAKAHVRDPALLADLEKFNAQEGQHYRQHARFNDIFSSRAANVVAMEKELDADYTRFTQTKSLRFNLAYAEGFEAFTMAMARVFTEEANEGWHPVVLDLFQWHLVEELEHRTVAFDVYNHVCRGYFYRLFVGWYAQWHLMRFMLRAGRALLEADPTASTKYGGPRARKAREKKLWRRLRRRLLPKVLYTYLPWYTPRSIEMPAKLAALQDHYTRMAVVARTQLAASTTGD